MFLVIMCSVDSLFWTNICTRNEEKTKKLQPWRRIYLNYYNSMIGNLKFTVGNSETLYLYKNYVWTNQDFIYIIVIILRGINSWQNVSVSGHWNWHKMGVSGPAILGPRNWHYKRYTVCNLTLIHK